MMAGVLWANGELLPIRPQDINDFAEMNVERLADPNVIVGIIITGRLYKNSKRNCRMFIALDKSAVFKLTRTAAVWAHWSISNVPLSEYKPYEINKIVEGTLKSEKYLKRSLSGVIDEMINIVKARLLC
jgi:hypothetical protein